MIKITWKSPKQVTVEEGITLERMEVVVYCLV